MWEARKLSKFAVLVNDKIKINKTYELEDLEKSSNQEILVIKSNLLTNKKKEDNELEQREVNFNNSALAVQVRSRNS